MPQFQMIDLGPSAAAQAAGNFGAGFSDSLKRARQQQAQADMLERILNPQQESAVPMNQQQATSYLGPQQGPPDNIGQLLNNVQQNPDNLARMGIVSGGAPQQTNRITPQKMAQIQVVAPEIAKALQPVYESQSAKEKEGVKADVKRSGEFLGKVDQIREGIPRKELSLRQIDEAIKSRGNLDFLGDTLADITGREALRSAKGAQLLSATKEFFLSDLGSIPGLRANQFLEKALSSALTDPARKQEANEMVAAGMRSNLMLDKVKAELTSRLEDHYRQTLGYVPASISKDVNKALTPYAQEIQDNWANEVQHITERHNPQIEKFMKVSNDPARRKAAAKNVKLKKAIPGAVLDETMGMILLEKYNDDEAKALEAARKLGYKIPGMQ